MCGLNIGTRNICVLLLPPYEMKIGAHVYPVIEPVLIRRLYELTVGQLTATIAAACFLSPPRNWYASLDRPQPRLSAASPEIFLPVLMSASDMLKCAPDPVLSA